MLNSIYIINLFLYNIGDFYIYYHSKTYSKQIKILQIISDSDHDVNLLIRKLVNSDHNNLPNHLDHDLAKNSDRIINLQIPIYYYNDSLVYTGMTSRYKLNFENYE